MERLSRTAASAQLQYTYMILRRTTVLAVALAALLVVLGLAARALTPAGTNIIAKATAAFSNSAGVSMPSVSSNSVTVTVDQVGGVEVALPGGSTQSLTLGQLGGVAFSVTNSGNGDDTSALSATSSNSALPVKIVEDANGDGILQSTEASASAVTSTGSMSGGSSGKFIAVVSPTSNAGEGTQATITITATSDFDSSKSSTASATVTLAQSAYIHNWLLNGPYANSDKSTILTTDYLGGEAGLTPKDGDVTAGHTWNTYSSQTDRVDLLQAVANVSYAAAYACAYVYSPTAASAELWIGSDDGNEVWLNGEVVATNNVFRAYAADQDKVPVSLDAGWNTLLVKIANGVGNWAFSVRVCDAAGNPISGFKYSTIPPEGKDTTPPVISNVKVSSVTTSSATVSWTTDENSSTEVLYGTASTSENTASGPSDVTEHTVTLTGLTGGAKYVFSVRSTDASGNTALSSEGQFTTTAPPPPPSSVTYIRNWLLNGYYSNTDKASRLSTDYLGMESLSAPKAGDKEGADTWTIDNSTTDKVDLLSFYQGPTNCAAYACAYVKSAVKVDALLKIGSDDGVKVLLNGNTVFTNDIYRGYITDQDTVPVTLQQGWNRLLVKVSQGTGKWGFSVKLTNTAGGDLSGIAAATDTGDRSAPVISNLLVSSTTTSEATIEWDTDEPSTTEVGYGVNDIAENAYGDAGLVTHHVAKLTNLQAGTTYKYKVYSADVQDNLVASDESTFDTVGNPEETSYITNWLVNGVYDNNSKSTRLSQSYLPSESSIYPYTGYTSNSKPWIRPKVGTDGKIDLAATYGGPNSCVGYAHVYIHSQTAQTVYALMGSDDGLKVWFDGWNVWTNDVYRPFSPDQDRFPLSLSAGWHRMLVKVSQGGGKWGFCLRFTDSSGNPAHGLTSQVDRPW